MFILLGRLGWIMVSSAGLGSGDELVLQGLRFFMYELRPFLRVVQHFVDIVEGLVVDFVLAQHRSGCFALFAFS